MEILYRGAESIIRVAEYEGRKAIMKERIKKGYRIDQIDDSLRKLRTRKEVKLLTEARKSGVPTPQILHVDEGGQAIVMEFIEGKRVKELLNSSNEHDVRKICLEIGRMVGKLHSAGIIHGDLTTSNMIVKGEMIYLIDFGLSFRDEMLESRGVDVHVFYQTLISSHPEHERLMAAFAIGYRSTFKDADIVLERVREIEYRGRYKTETP
jgi:Kae1-associated kinase Bud32